MAELVCRADDPAWLEHRRAGITATDIAAILGLSPYESAFSLYWEKTRGDSIWPDSDRLRLGRELENYVANRWNEANGLRMFTSDVTLNTRDCITPEALYRSGERPWQMATVDGTINCEPIKLKTWATRDGWGDDGSDVIPAQVRAQLLWQMDVLGARAGHVGCLFLPSGEFRSYRLAHDHEWPIERTHYGECSLCTDVDEMRLAGAEFWLRLSEPDKYPPPDADSSAATLAMLRALHSPLVPDKIAEVTPEARDEWLECKARVKRAKEHQRAAEMELRIQADAATAYAVNGDIFARRVISDAEVKACVRHSDYLRATGKDNDDGE